VLAGVSAAIALVAAAILWDVLATVFVAVTVAYAIRPVYRWFHTHGLKPWWASAMTLVVTVVGGLAALSPLVVVAWLRIDDLRAVLTSVPVPPTLTVELFGYTETIVVSEVVPDLFPIVQSFILGISTAIPILGIKFGVFALVVFALLMRGNRTRSALMNLVPSGYRDVAERFDTRARETLFAIYVVQAATAIGTFAIALPVFAVLGYDFPFTLATVAAVLQFLPIVGPSVLVGALAIFDLAAGATIRAMLVILVGGTLVAWLPDPIIRPRLASRTANLPGSLYFVGFTGGLFSMGVVGIVAGPLVVALLAEAVSVLADEVETQRTPESGEGVSVGVSPAPDGFDKVGSDTGEDNVEPDHEPTSTNGGTVDELPKRSPEDV
jgi:predicted PurR-regulated permease PerM